MFAVIVIPTFPLQAVLRHEPQLWWRPVGLIDAQQNKAPVFQMTCAARDAGVTSTQALARCGDIIIKTRSAVQEKTANDALLQTAYHFSPRIESTDDGICTMDLQGLSVAPSTPQTEPGPLEEWAARIISALARLNLRGQIGIAATPNLALQAARCAKPFLFIADATGFMATLPVESLDLTPPIADILQRWGIRSVGHFTALGKDKIAERLGPKGIDLFDRAAVDAVRPLNLVTPSESFSEAIDFEIEIESLQPLLFVLNRFIAQLAARLTVAGFVAEELRLCLKLSSGDTYEHVFTVPSPTANTTVLLRMIDTHLETVRTESSIVGLELLARPTRSENYQFGLFETALRDPNHFSETLARLSALCGIENVGTPVLQETYRPDAFKMQKPAFDAAAAIDPTRSAGGIACGLSLRRFRPPFHADVEIKNGEPVFISSLKLHSHIQHISGPFRSSGDWWEQDKVWNRDEWDIQTRDGIYRIYREKQDWFVEGIYD